MRIKDLMSSDVEVIRPETTIADASELMKTRDIGVLPICDGGRLIGILTDRDIVVRGTADGFHPETMSAREVMTSKVIYCFEDQEVTEVGRIMKEKQIRRLPVLNREKHLVGIISLGDLAGAAEIRSWRVRRSKKFLSREVQSNKRDEGDSLCQEAISPNIRTNRNGRPSISKQVIGAGDLARK